ncbi:MAG: hypothetical protein ACLQM8_25000 [Limisphaerales bacterium]
MKIRIGQLLGWIISRHFLCLCVLLLLQLPCFGQVNSGSNGSDGPFNPTAASTVINMADHPNGIYQYTSVNIPGTVAVTFIPNANNTPVTWLVKGNVVINGVVSVSAPNVYSSIGGAGGPGGYAGGSGGSSPSAGLGPGGGGFSTSINISAAGGSFATQGRSGVTQLGPTYGNSFLLPLVGGSGGGGFASAAATAGGGGGGGGAIMIAASGSISINGWIYADGGDAGGAAGCGSGGAIRLVATTVTGSGVIAAGPGGEGSSLVTGGDGRIRIDSFQNTFGGTLDGEVSQGYQPIIIPVTGQGVQLSIASVGGASVSANPSGQLVSPDAIISAQQEDPVPVVVNCSNLPLNTPITLSVKPVNGSPVSAVGYNATGTLASSAATISINMPRGGGIIYATAATAN